MRAKLARRLHRENERVDAMLLCIDVVAIHISGNPLGASAGSHNSVTDETRRKSCANNIVNNSDQIDLLGSYYTHI